MARAAMDPREREMREAGAELGARIYRAMQTQVRQEDKRSEEERLLTVDETAETLKVSRQRVYRFIAGGELELIKFGRSSRIRYSDVQRLMGGAAA